jgi:hypothetical protein
MVLALLSSLSFVPALAQAGGVTLTGVVIDATSGAPVSGALVSVGDRGPRGIADGEGRFRIAGVSTGGHRLRAERFGYHDLDQDVRVTDPPEPLVLRMEVDPVALEGLTVTGGARVALGGRVVDASTGEGIPWAEVTLTRDTQRQDARASGDAQGVFRLSAVPTGEYFLRVERLGYEGQYIPMFVGAPPEPVEVRLRPDSAMLEGLATMNAQRRTRLNATPFTTRAFDEARLRESRAPGMRHFLEFDAFMGLVQCGNPPSGRNDCVEVRNRQVRPFVFIDELPAFGLDQLDAYLPSDLYSLEYMLCAGRPVLRAYTYRYMDRMARRPRLLIDACQLPPFPG